MACSTRATMVAAALPLSCWYRMARARASATSNGLRQPAACSSGAMRRTQGANAGSALSRARRARSMSKPRLKRAMADPREVLLVAPAPGQHCGNRQQQQRHAEDVDGLDALAEAFDVGVQFALDAAQFRAQTHLVGGQGAVLGAVQPVFRNTAVHLQPVDAGLYRVQFRQQAGLAFAVGLFGGAADAVDLDR